MSFQEIAMAYRIDIETDFDRDPICNAFGWESISFILGVDLVLDCTVVMTAVFACKEEGIYELRFGIEEREIERDGYTSGLDYSIEYSKRYVPQQHRADVLELLLVAIEALAVKTKPSKLTMQSYYKNPPEKALKKYHRIANLMKGLGYEQLRKAADSCNLPR
jgi:hypothetical protein